MSNIRSGNENNILLSLFRKSQILRSQDLEKNGISRQTLSRLVKNKVVERVGRGLYRMFGAPSGEMATLAEVSRAVPKGVICLLSALRFHGLTTQSPPHVWMAIPVKSHLPRVNMPVRFARFSGAAFSSGVDSHIIEGVKVRVYCAAKTVADCFKYRNKIGLDVAHEALRDYLLKKKASLDDLWSYAKICRVANVIRPYLEASGL
jgi:predicted transcriptional regulator of viral defense system